MDKPDKKISRRGFLPLLGGGLILPLVSFGKTNSNETTLETEYEILLKPDGTTVKVKKSVVSKATIVEKNISNSSLLSWLKNK